MTPKEKAKELYCKYADALNIRDLQITANPFAKQSALIAVDETINNFGLLSEGKQHYASSNAIQYYEQVRAEIEKL